MNRVTISGTTALILATLLPFASPAADITVPGEFATIEAALLEAQTGDRVLVAPGVYREWGLKLRGGVTLEGNSTDASLVVIDAQGQGRILDCQNLERLSTVRNLTFTGGHASGATTFLSSGGAILCNYSSLLVENCVFTGNRADHNGGAVWVFESAPQFYNCRFENNTAGAGGGALGATFEASPMIRDSWFENNSAAWGGAISCRDYSSPTISSSVFRGNEAKGEHGYGGGLFSDLDSKPSLALCTFDGNTANYGGGVANFAASGATLTRCTLAGNTALVHGGGIYSNAATPVISASIVAFQIGDGIYSSGGLAPVVDRTNVFGNSQGDWLGPAAPPELGATNLSSDPLFCTPAEDEAWGMNVEETSPCHPDSNGGVTLGAWPAGCEQAVPLLVNFDAAWQGDLALLTWTIPADAVRVPIFRLTGSLDAEPESEWSVPFRDAGGGVYEAEDPTAGRTEQGPMTFRLYASYDGQIWTLVTETGLDELPPAVMLQGLKAWPNPFNPSTTISFEMGRTQRARVAIYDLAGRLVKVVADRVYAAGPHDEPWLGDTVDGGLAASGAYVVLVETDGDRIATKVTLLK